MPRAIMRHQVKTTNSGDPSNAPCIEINLYDEIVAEQFWVDYGFGMNAKTFEADLIASLGEGGPQGSTIVAKINSYGGDVANGVAMYNVLRNLAAKGATVKTQCIGVAYSAASVVMMAGDVREICLGAEAMIHEARYGWIPSTVDAKALDAYAADLRRTNQNLAELYSSRMGKPVDEILALMAAETYLSGQAAIDAGFATATVEAPAQALAGTAEMMQLAGVRAVSAKMAFAGVETKPVPAPSLAAGVLGRIAQAMGVPTLDAQAQERASALSAQLTAAEALRKTQEAAIGSLTTEINSLTSQIAVLGTEHAQALTTATEAHTKELEAIKAAHEAEKPVAIDAAVRAFALAHSINYAPNMPPPENVSTPKSSLEDRWGALATHLANPRSRA